MPTDALYFRVSSDRQTTQNQFEDLLQVAEKDGSGRDWPAIRRRLSECVYVEERPGRHGSPRIVYRVRPELAAELAGDRIYIEQAKSGKVGSKRPMFDQLKRDALMQKFDRLLVWKVSRLGRDMREVISTVYELADAGVTVVPIQSQTGPITSTMGKLLWAIQSWYAEMENVERSQTIRAGQARARAAGKHIGRPKRIFSRAEVVELRRAGMSWAAISERLSIGEGTARRAYLQVLQGLGNASTACQNPIVELE